MTKKLMIGSFIASISFLVIGIIFTPFAIKSGSNDFIILANEFTSRGEETFKINDNIEIIEYFADEETLVQVHTGVRDQEVNVEYRGVFTDNTSYSFEKNGNIATIIQQYVHQDGELSSSVFGLADPRYGVHLFVPKNTVVVTSGRAYSYSENSYDISDISAEIKMIYDSEEESNKFTFDFNWD